jgi:hypothetical protein
MSANLCTPVRNEPNTGGAQCLWCADPVEADEDAWTLGGVLIAHGPCVALYGYRVPRLRRANRG